MTFTQNQEDRTFSSGGTAELEGSPIEGHNPEIVVGAVYANDEALYLGVQIHAAGVGYIFRLIGLPDGNRWDDSGVVPDSFVRVPAGRTITITTGE